MSGQVHGLIISSDQIMTNAVKHQIQGMKEILLEKAIIVMDAELINTLNQVVQLKKWRHLFAPQDPHIESTPLDDHQTLCHRL